jgi:hypothetical protein
MGIGVRLRAGAAQHITIIGFLFDYFFLIDEAH